MHPEDQAAYFKLLRELLQTNQEGAEERSQRCIHCGYVIQTNYRDALDRTEAQKRRDMARRERCP